MWEGWGGETEMGAGVAAGPHCAERAELVSVGEPADI